MHALGKALSAHPSSEAVLLTVVVSWLAKASRASGKDRVQLYSSLEEFLSDSLASASGERRVICVFCLAPFSRQDCRVNAGPRASWKAALHSQLVRLACQPGLLQADLASLLVRRLRAQPCTTAQQALFLGTAAADIVDAVAAAESDGAGGLVGRQSAGPCLAWLRASQTRADSCGACRCLATGGPGSNPGAAVL